MKKIIPILGLFVLTSLVAGCSWTDRQIGPNDYEISGYFDFTMMGEVVVKGLEDQARLYCKGIQENLVPQIYLRSAAGKCSYSLSLYSEQPRLSEILRGMWTLVF